MGPISARPWSHSRLFSAARPGPGPGRAPRRVVFSGIQPSGVPHIGNYMGALRNWVRIQHASSSVEEPDKPQIYYAIAGMHAITLPRDPLRLRQDRWDTMCALLAIGLSPERCCLFNQDQVPAHAELAWILNCLTPMGKLSRMTTWKAQVASSRNSNSLSEVDESMLHLGLFSYPVLQSADVLLYKATQVPVGEDQEQHLELTRAIAKIFNHQYKTRLFPTPKPIFTPQNRILNLRNPALKMSKSLPNPASRIMITDSPDEIKSKIQSAVTDSIPTLDYDPIRRPGVSNLIDIYNGLVGGPISQEDPAHLFKGKMASHLKAELTDVLVEHLRPIQEEFRRLKNDQGGVEQVFARGACKATGVAQATLNEVKTIVGLA